LDPGDASEAGDVTFGADDREAVFDAQRGELRIDIDTARSSYRTMSSRRRLVAIRTNAMSDTHEMPTRRSPSRCSTIHAAAASWKGLVRSIE